MLAEIMVGTELFFAGLVAGILLCGYVLTTGDAKSRLRAKWMAEDANERE